MGAACRRRPASPALGRAAVEAPRGQVLGDEDDLADPGAELVHLGQHGVVSGRDRWRPRNDGMAQKPQRRSQPSATFT